MLSNWHESWLFAILLSPIALGNGWLFHFTGLATAHLGLGALAVFWKDHCMVLALPSWLHHGFTWGMPQGNVIHQNKIIPASRSRLAQIWSLGLGPVSRKCSTQCYDTGLHSGFLPFPASVTSASVPQFDRIPPLCRNPFSHPSLRFFLKEQIMIASYSVAHMARPLHHLQIPWRCFIGNHPKAPWRLCQRQGRRN